MSKRKHYPAPGYAAVGTISDGSRVIRFGAPPYELSDEERAWVEAQHPYALITEAEYRRLEADAKRAAEPPKKVAADSPAKGGGKTATTTNGKEG